MKMTFQAFRWECNSPSLNLDSFISKLKEMSGRTIKNRIIYLTDDNGFWKGLILTVKDLNQFTKLVSSQQEVRLDIHELNADERVADFNFFVIDKKKGYGLYQHYHHSCSLNLFNIIARQHYMEAKNEMLNKEKEKLENEKASKKNIKSSLEKFRGNFTGSIIEKKGTFAERVAKLRDAHEAEIEFDVVSINDGAFQAVSSHLKRVKHQLFFLKNTSRLDRVKGLASILTGQNVSKAKVIGVDENGNDIVYKMFNDFDKFATYDYEDMVSELNLDQSKIHESIVNNKIVGELSLVFNRISAALA